MKRIEKERLFELKRLKELEWLDKRKEKEKEVASNVAKEYLNNIIEEVWDELKRNSKNIRLEKAALCTEPAPGGSRILEQPLQKGKEKVIGIQQVHPSKS